MKKLRGLLGILLGIYVVFQISFFLWNRKDAISNSLSSIPVEYIYAGIGIFALIFFVFVKIKLSENQISFKVFFQELIQVVRIILSIIGVFLGGKKKSTFSKSTLKHSNWVNSRAGCTSSIGKVRVKGFILPKTLTVGGDLMIKYDGSYCRKKGSKGKTNIYVTDGNAQVIYRKPQARQRYIVQGQVVDTYNNF